MLNRYSKLISLNRSALLCAVLGAMTLAACGSSGNHGSGKHSVADKDQITTSEKPSVSNGDVDEQAEALLDEGEALLTPEALAKSQEKFRAALKLAPENPRAKFWVSMNDFLMEMHGMLARVRPFYLSVEGGEERYNKMTESYRKSSQSPISRFFLTGPADIQTTAEFSEFIDRLRLKISVARKTVGAIRDSEFTITIPEALAGSTGRDHSCPGFSFGPIKFQPAESSCSNTIVGQVGMNTSDFDQLGQILSGIQLELELLTAFRINPQALFAQLGKPNHTKKEAEDFVTRLFTGGDGSLARPKPFLDLQEMGSQMLLAMRYQQEHQATDCPKGYMNPLNRKGYLFSSGNCISLSQNANDRERSFQALEAMANGQPVTAVDGSSEIDYLELQNNPPANIKTLFPIKFDECVNIVSMHTENLPKIFRRIDTQKVFGSRECKRSQK